MIIKMIALVCFFALMIGVGIYSQKKVSNASDFVLGGRSVGPWVTAFSYGTSYFSAVVFIGYAGQFGWRFGIASTWIGLANAFIGSLLAWRLLGRRTRVMSNYLGASTMPEFFGKRFNSSAIRIAASLITFIFLIPYTASVYNGLSRLFGMAFDIPYEACVIGMAVLTGVYVVLGGYMASSITDFIQGIVMSIALVIVLCFGVSVAGGLDAVIANGSELVGYLSLTQMHNTVTHEISDYSVLTMCSMLAWGLGYFGMPHILLRFMAIEDRDKLKISRRVATIWVVIAMGVALLIGVVGNAVTAAGALPFLEGNTSETIIVKIADLMGKYGVLFAIMGGVILAGILSSTMSTADAQLLAASSSISENLLRGFFRVQLSTKASIKIARAAVVAISLVAMFIARDPNSSVFRIVSFAWAGFGATFGPVVLLALFWRRSNKQGALAGMVTGGVMVFVWKFIIAPMGGVFAIYELLPAFLLALAVNVIVSMVTPEPDKEIQDAFDRVKQSV